jgi:hypothetical protein
VQNPSLRFGPFSFEPPRGGSNMADLEAPGEVLRQQELRPLWAVCSTF